jgi:nitroimidazol reductase NimA-like FMN-containing flavoprotein (pyridoxamine 5'-phosphate oxidase superfamily)
MKKSKYPQAPPFDNKDEMEAFLERPLFAKFSSHNEDGTIHSIPLYYLYTSGEFLFGTQDKSRKVRNIKRNNKVTILIDAAEPVLQAVIVYGEAILDYKDVVSKRVKIFDRYYMDKERARDFAERLAKAWKTVVIRVKPTKIVTLDYSKPFSID